MNCTVWLIKSNQIVDVDICYVFPKYNLHSNCFSPLSHSSRAHAGLGHTVQVLRVESVGHSSPVLLPAGIVLQPLNVGLLKPFLQQSSQTDPSLFLSTYYGGDSSASVCLGHGRTFPQPVSQVTDGVLIHLLGHDVDHGIDHDAGPVDDVGKDVEGRVFEANVELILTTLNGFKKS